MTKKDIIVVSGLYKKTLNNRADIREHVKKLLGWKKRSDQERLSLKEGESWALKDVSFTLRQGETLGIVGVHDSGKTLLLRLLMGIEMPDDGQIEINGSVGGIFALKTGLKEELTGLENLYVKAALLGKRSEEVDDVLEEVVSFSGLAPEVLNAPIKYLSSEEKSRLIYALSVHLKSDIFLIDEILSVGNASFQKKCLERVKAIQKESTMVIVSRKVKKIRALCDTVIVLNEKTPVIDRMDSFVVDGERLMMNVTLLKNDFDSIDEDIDGFRGYSRFDPERGAIVFVSSVGESDGDEVSLDWEIDLEASIARTEVPLFIEAVDLSLMTREKEKIRVSIRDITLMRASYQGYLLIPYKTAQENLSILVVRKRPYESQKQVDKSIRKLSGIKVKIFISKVKYDGAKTQAMFRLASLLRDEGFDVTIVALMMSKEKVALPFPDGVAFDFVYLDLLDHEGTEKYPLYPNGPMVTDMIEMRLQAYLETMDTDVLYLPNYDSQIYMLFTTYTPSNTLTIISERNTRRYAEASAPEEELTRNAKTVEADRWMSFAMREFDAVHIIDPVYEETCTKTGAKRIIYIPDESDAKIGILWREELIRVLRKENVIGDEA